jgi:hypothetical protein
LTTGTPVVTVGTGVVKSCPSKKLNLLGLSSYGLGIASGITGSYLSSLEGSNVKSAVFTGMCAIRGRWSDKKEPVIPDGVTIATTGGVFLDARVFFTVLDSVALMMSISRVEHFRPLDNSADVTTQHETLYYCDIVLVILEKNII